MMTTQTGIPIMECGDCGGAHPVTRRHCAGCGRPSLFLDAAGACLRCMPGAATSGAEYVAEDDFFKTGAR